MENKRIVLGVCGGIACYKSLEILRRLKDAGAEVQVVMTQAATRFVTPLSFQTLSGLPVAMDLFSLREEEKIGHIALGENKDLLLIAPATANMIGKMAHGIADDYLSTLYLAFDGPVAIAPAMNSRMWEHQAVQDNLKILKQRGVQIIEPGIGFLACGTEGRGRMAEVDEILEKTGSWTEPSFPNTNQPLSSEGPLMGIRILVTAGPTLERIDAVRYISNHSSGKMGYALAEVCKELGGEVTLISGPVHIDAPAGVKRILVESAEEMKKEVLGRAASCGLIIKAAAVSDYKVERPETKKRKKKGGFRLELVENPDILAELGRNKKDGQYLVGFAAETDRLVEYALKKLKDKNLDLVVANDVSDKDAGFYSESNRVVLLDGTSVIECPSMHKKKVARKILEFILASSRWQQVAPKIRRP